MSVPSISQICLRSGRHSLFANRYQTLLKNELDQLTFTGDDGGNSYDTFAVPDDLAIAASEEDDEVRCM